MIRERYRRGLTGVTIAPSPDDIDDRTEQRTVAPIVPGTSTSLLNARLAKIQAAVVPVGEA